MKKRISRVLNFFAFNLLFFALYLNFIHKDSQSQETATPQFQSANIKGTVLVSDPKPYLNKVSDQSMHPTASLQN